MGNTTKNPDAPITIKKYANRRLYNTATSSYVTLDHLCTMVKEGVEFVVYDAKSGDDITRSVLTQIIVEEENKGEQTLLPINFLRQLISYYGDASQQVLLPKYLDMTMQSFTENQDKMQGYIKETFGSVFPVNQFDEIGKQNTAMFEQAMQFFAPFAQTKNAPKEPETAKPEPSTKPSSPDSELQTLKEQLNNMQTRLNDMEKGS